MVRKNGVEGGIAEGRIAKVLKNKESPPFVPLGLLSPFVPLCRSLPEINPVQPSR